MPLTAPRNTPKRGNGPIAELIVVAVAASTTVHQGGLVAIDTDGKARPARASTTDRIAGRALDSVDNSAGGEVVRIESGVFRFDNSADGDEIAVDDIGKVCFAVDDKTVALTSGAGTRVAAGVIVDVDESGVWVECRLSLPSVDVAAALASLDARITILENAP